jgi:metallophosphoesterase (TIGR00282 family)
MLKVLFIGDIVGRIGRETIGKVLPELKKEKKIDIVIANAENSAHGSGITDRIIEELESYGIDYFTMGDHALRRKKQAGLYNLENIVRPANFPPNVPGHGYCLIPVQAKNILLINLIGRVFMRSDYDCPFRKLDEILANVNLPENNIFAIIIDIHAETTSEKIALMHYADGRVSAVLGTHTHVKTADEQTTDKGTAFITDVGMVGAGDSSLGIAKEGAIRTFLTQIKETHIIPKTGKAIFNSVLLGMSAKTTTIKSITKNIIIN